MILNITILHDFKRNHYNFIFSRTTIHSFCLHSSLLKVNTVHMYIETTSRDSMVQFAFGIRFPTGGSLCRNSHPEWTESRNVEKCPVCQKFGYFFPNFCIRDIWKVVSKNHSHDSGGRSMGRNSYSLGVRVTPLLLCVSRIGDTLG